MRRFTCRWVDAKSALYDASEHHKSVDVPTGNADEKVECEVSKIVHKAFGHMFELATTRGALPITIQTTHGSDDVEITIYERR